MDLIRGLGFRIGERLDQALVLTDESSGQRAVAVLLERTETFEAASGRLGMSPAAYGLDKASKRNARWLILLRGDQIRLYATKPGTGVGSRSPVETWFQLDLAAILPEDAGYLDLVFSAPALGVEGTVADLLARSRQFATDLGDRLRQRVYERVIPDLAVGVAEALSRLRSCEGSGDLSYAYRLSLRIFFRLLFQAYAEDRGLLPYGRNDRFDRHSLKRLAVTLSSSERPAAFDARATTLWRDLQTIWRAIDKGDRGLDVPAYNGGLFDADPAFRREGTDLADIELGDDCIGPALRDLLVDETPDGDIGPVDFRSLSVREFGTIYEGLLESELSRADLDLTVDKKNVYVPARPKDEVVVEAGEVYFHNRSGERKATGSYFTPEFAVEHLLDHALEPVLAEHLKRVEELHDGGDHASAAEAFWDFRVADISMGSGHFLIAAVDRIERGMRRFLADRPLPSVNDELRRLKRKAREALGPTGSASGDEGPAIEDATLLRRQIARRCIHGGDVNETAVELARVAVWIHTFVPGLPMSTLDHNLVCGDSLTGIGTVDEALEVLDPTRGDRQRSLFSQPIENAMAEAAEALAEHGRALEADIAEVNRNRDHLTEAREKAEPARRLFDAAVAIRCGWAEPSPSTRVSDVAAIATHEDVAAQLKKIRGLAHLPCLFPEVFGRPNGGFDVLVGNPPWDKLLHSPRAFWVLRDPGLNALTRRAQQQRIETLRAERPDCAAEEQHEKEQREFYREVVLTWPELQGPGHHDFGRLFFERSLRLARSGAGLGLVLPPAFSSRAGWSSLRKRLLATYETMVVQCRNTDGWLFEDVHASTQVVLLSGDSLEPPSTRKTVRVVPEVQSLDQFRHATVTDAVVLDPLKSELPTQELGLPWFRSRGEAELLTCFSGYPSLGGDSGWISGRSDSRWDFSRSGSEGEFVVAPSRDLSDSIEVWRVLRAANVRSYEILETPKKPRTVIPCTSLASKSKGLVRNRSGYHLAAEHPSIVFRYPSRNNDSRTVIAAMLPTTGWFYSTGYVHGIRHRKETNGRELLALLALLNSPILDWWARRFSDRHVNAPIVRQLPLPAWTADDREYAASRASALLWRFGARDAHVVGTLSGESDPGAPTYRLRAEVDGCVARGFGLGLSEVQVVLDDFNTRGVSPEHRRELLSIMRAMQ